MGALLSSIPDLDPRTAAPATVPLTPSTVASCVPFSAWTASNFMFATPSCLCTTHWLHVLGLGGPREHQVDQADSSKGEEV